MSPRSKQIGRMKMEETIEKLEAEIGIEVEMLIYHLKHHGYYDKDLENLEVLLKVRSMLNETK